MNRYFRDEKSILGSVIDLHCKVSELTTFMKWLCKTKKRSPTKETKAYFT